jgi:MFS family permease
MAGDSAPNAMKLAETTPLAPFRHMTFTVLWTATVIANIGTWMQNAAAGWLMTGLNPDPLIVSLVQVASSAPMFLLGLPAGALADLFDRRRLLLGVQLVVTGLVAGFGVLVWLGMVTRPSGSTRRAISA